MKFLLSILAVLLSATTAAAAPIPRPLDGPLSLGGLPLDGLLAEVEKEARPGMDQLRSALGMGGDKDGDKSSSTDPLSGLLGGLGGIVKA